MNLAFGTSAFDRERGNFPSLPVVNMFAEQEPVENAVILQSRPGLESTGTWGAGPVKALFMIDAVLSGDLFGISASHLYRQGVDKGAIDGTGPAKIAGFEGIIFATQGNSLYAYDGAALTSVVTPGGFQTLSLCIGASRLVVIDKATGSFYWSDVLTDTIAALSFATAENSPDLLKECLYIGDTLVLFGSRTVEFWPVTTDDLAPFQPLVGRTYQVGIRDTGCACEFTGTFAWITHRNRVCITDPNNVISLPGLEAKIKDSSTVSLWTFRIESTEFLAVRLDTETWVYSGTSGQWAQFESYGEDNWIPQCAAEDYLGSSIDGRIIQFSDDHSDFTDVLERRFRAGAVVDVPSMPLNNLFIRTNPGQTPFIVGDYTDPVVEVQTSKDGGFTWSPWRQKTLGTQGQYRKRVMWSGLGHFSYPGILCEFRVTDPVPFRVAKVVANDPYGGV